MMELVFQTSILMSLNTFVVKFNKDFLGTVYCVGEYRVIWDNNEIDDSVL